MDSQGKAGGRVGFAVVEGLAVPQRRCSSSTAVNPPPIHDTLGLLYSGFAHVGRGVALGREHQSQQPSLTPVKWKDAAFAWQGSTSLSNDHHVFMSLSTSVSQQNREARLLSTFQQISGDKVSFDKHDLERYAATKGLPVNYVKSFIHAIQKSGRWSLLNNSGHVTYEKFSTYVASRETALKQVFETLDSDNNGEISADDVEIALAHVRVKCPDSKCVYQCRRHAVHDFVSTISQGKNRPVSFNEFRDFFLLLPQNDMIMVCAYHPSRRHAIPGSCCSRGDLFL